MTPVTNKVALVDQAIPSIGKGDDACAVGVYELSPGNLKLIEEAIPYARERGNGVGLTQQRFRDLAVALDELMTQIAAYKTQYVQVWLRRSVTDNRDCVGRCLLLMFKQPIPAIG